MTDTSTAMNMTFGNADNIQVIENPVMLFQDIVVSETPGGAELECDNSPTHNPRPREGCFYL